MSEKPTLDFDPIARAAELWSARVGDATSMELVTSVMRVQQILLTSLDGVLKPHGLTFSRYEVLVLLDFSREGRLSLSKIGARLQVHPTSVTNAIDRLEAAGLVQRITDSEDRRRTLAELTDLGRARMLAATEDLQTANFFLPALPDAVLGTLTEGLRAIRHASGDFA